jgi:2-oxoglutarate dehydrogenase E1 component
MCVSIEDFTQVVSKKQSMTTVNKADVKTLVFVTGKFYYDITAERENNGRTDVACSNRAIVSVASRTIKTIIALYPNADDYVWAQKSLKHGSIQLYVDELI